MKISLQLLDEMKSAPYHAMLPRLIIQANKSLNNMTELVDNILNASNFNEGQFKINASEVNIFSVVQEFCETFITKSAWNIILTGDKKIIVSADKAKILQVLSNLVNNAIKYAPNSLTIDIIIEKTVDSAKISVQDYGMGIPVEKQGPIFNRYYRIDSTIGHGSSLGLGLYICSEIIKKYNGDIGVISELEKGSTFWFTLPVQ